MSISISLVDATNVTQGRGVGDCMVRSNSINGVSGHGMVTPNLSSELSGPMAMGTNGGLTGTMGDVMQTHVAGSEDKMAMNNLESDLHCVATADGNSVSNSFGADDMVDGSMTNNSLGVVLGATNTISMNDKMVLATSNNESSGIDLNMLGFDMKHLGITNGGMVNTIKMGDGLSESVGISDISGMSDTQDG